MSTPTEVLAALVRARAVHRTLWGGICLILAGVVAVFGVPLAIDGTRPTPLPSVYIAVTRYLPGGVHAYGVIMCAFAVALLAGLAPPLWHQPMRVRWIDFTLVCFVIFTVGVVVSFASAWWLIHVRTWQAMAYWASLGAFAGLAIWKAPTSGSDGAR